MHGAPRLCLWHTAQLGDDPFCYTLSECRNGEKRVDPDSRGDDGAVSDVQAFVNAPIVVEYLAEMIDEAGCSSLPHGASA